VRANGYVLITPARNEEAHIEKTIESVLSQSILPRKWVIVNDGSEDRTEEIVQSVACKASFVKLISKKKDGQRNFGSKVEAFRTGYECLGDVPYDFVGNLDADVSFAPRYYETILEKYHDDPQLGLAGGIILERIGERFIRQRISTNSVAGAVQLFRRACYEAIGGYIQIPNGGIDAAAEILVRAHGWTVRTFPELSVHHHRRVSTGRGRVLSTRFYEGITNYSLGYHPLFQTLSCAYRIADKPYLTGSMLQLLGYAWAWVTHREQVLPQEIVRRLRSEQMSRVTLAIRTARQGQGYAA
jgi:glycosyltransferase involved in cell wall biosynthesis